MAESGKRMQMKEENRQNAAKKNLLHEKNCDRPNKTIKETHRTKRQARKGRTGRIAGPDFSFR